MQGALFIESGSGTTGFLKSPYNVRKTVSGNDGGTELVLNTLPVNLYRIFVYIAMLLATGSYTKCSDRLCVLWGKLWLQVQ